MARRFRRRRFRRGAPVKRQNLVWSSVVYSEVNVAADALLQEVVLVDPIILQPEAGSAYARELNVRRIILKGGLTMLPLTTTFAIDIWAYHFAVYIIDREDTDASLLSTAVGDILEGGARRVLHVDVFPLTSYETPAAQFGVGQHMPFARIDVDLKVPLKLKRDDLIVAGFQSSTALGATVNSITAHLVSRTLLVE